MCECDGAEKRGREEMKIKRLEGKGKEEGPKCREMGSYIRQHDTMRTDDRPHHCVLRLRNKTPTGITITSWSLHPKAR